MNKITGLELISLIWAQILIDYSVHAGGDRITSVKGYMNK